MIIKNGFTLFEILVVLALTAAITAASTVALSQLQSVLKLRNSGDEIRSMIQVGRQYTLANKDSATFSVTMGSGIFKLLENSVELTRYQIPTGISVNPPVLSWNFTPVTGRLTGCSPCQITLSSLGNTEIINIKDNGMVY